MGSSDHPAFGVDQRVRERAGPRYGRDLDGQLRVGGPLLLRHPEASLEALGQGPRGRIARLGQEQPETRRAHPHGAIGLTRFGSDHINHVARNAVNTFAAAHAGAQKDDKKMEKKADANKGDMKKDDKKEDKKK